MNKNHLLFTTLIGLFQWTAAYALPFTILPAPGTVLPTQVNSGSSVSAYYTVYNNTGSTQSENSVVSLPPNVTQVVTDPSISDLCGSSFTLNGAGTSGSSCTLELSVTGAVDASDPNPAHHLFVCMSDGTSCAGTNFPLNVSEVGPLPPAQQTHFIIPGQTLETLQPALLASSTDGETWDVTDLSTQIDTVGLGQYTDMSCTDDLSLCVAVAVGGGQGK